MNRLAVRSAIRARRAAALARARPVQASRALSGPTHRPDDDPNSHDYTYQAVARYDEPPERSLIGMELPYEEAAALNKGVEEECEFGTKLQAYGFGLAALLGAYAASVAYDLLTDEEDPELANLPEEDRIIVERARRAHVAELAQKRAEKAAKVESLGELTRLGRDLKADRGTPDIEQIHQADAARRAIAQKRIETASRRVRSSFLAEGKLATDAFMVKVAESPVAALKTAVSPYALSNIAQDLVRRAENPEVSKPADGDAAFAATLAKTHLKGQVQNAILSGVQVDEVEAAEA